MVTTYARDNVLSSAVGSVYETILGCEIGLWYIASAEKATYKAAVQQETPNGGRGIICDWQSAKLAGKGMPKRALAAVGNVQKPVLILVVFINVGHERRCWKTLVLQW